eukprot:GHVP01031711.1.p1 GENE.GHVP01031711.1~~GHVP01031711.1.p1  ORF type:complete len:485 (+),score=90.39 GHVP01031711.1:1394-2848(+)
MPKDTKSGNSRIEINKNRSSIYCLINRDSRISYCRLPFLPFAPKSILLPSVTSSLSCGEADNCPLFAVAMVEAISQNLFGRSMAEFILKDFRDYRKCEIDFICVNVSSASIEQGILLNFLSDQLQSLCEICGKYVPLIHFNEMSHTNTLTPRSSNKIKNLFYEIRSMILHDVKKILLVVSTPLNEESTENEGLPPILDPNKVGEDPLTITDFVIYIRMLIETMNIGKTDENERYHMLTIYFNDGSADVPENLFDLHLNFENLSEELRQESISKLHPTLTERSVETLVKSTSNLSLTEFHKKLCHFVNFESVQTEVVALDYPNIEILNSIIQILECSNGFVFAALEGIGGSGKSRFLYDLEKQGTQVGSSPFAVEKIEILDVVHGMMGESIHHIEKAFQKFLGSGPSCLLIDDFCEVFGSFEHIGLPSSDTIERLANDNLAFFLQNVDNCKHAQGKNTNLLLITFDPDEPPSEAVRKRISKTFVI